MDIEKVTKGLKGQLSEQEKLVESLNVKLEPAMMESLLAVDRGFDKAKKQALFLYPLINLSALGFFKTIQDGELVMEEDMESTLDLKPNVDLPLSHGKDDAAKTPIDGTSTQTSHGDA